jgi:hypothetical protein
LRFDKPSAMASGRGSARTAFYILETLEDPIKHRKPLSIKTLTFGFYFHKLRIIDRLTTNPSCEKQTLFGE